MTITTYRSILFEIPCTMLTRWLAGVVSMPEQGTCEWISKEITGRVKSWLTSLGGIPVYSKNKWRMEIASCISAKVISEYTVITLEWAYPTSLIDLGTFQPRRISATIDTWDVAHKDFNTPTLHSCWLDDRSSNLHLLWQLVHAKSFSLLLYFLDSIAS